MNKTDNKTHIRNGVHRLNCHISKLEKSAIQLDGLSRDTIAICQSKKQGVEQCQ